MSISIGDVVYTKHTTAPDSLGVSWIYVTRREVLEAGGEAVKLSAPELADFPDHTPPAVADIPWCGPPGGIPVTVEPAAIGSDPGSQYLTTLDLPAPAVIDEGAGFALRAAHRNHRYVNNEAGKCEPELSVEDALLLTILDWRDPR